MGLLSTVGTLVGFYDTIESHDDDGGGSNKTVYTSSNSSTYGIKPEYYQQYKNRIDKIAKPLSELDGMSAAQKMKVELGPQRYNELKSYYLPTWISKAETYLPEKNPVEKAGSAITTSLFGPDVQIVQSPIVSWLVVGGIVYGGYKLFFDNSGGW